MEYVYVKDSEGYVFKKLASEVTADEKIITEKEYMKKSGLAGYEKQFGHGGARENAGRKRFYCLCQRTSFKLFSNDEITEKELLQNVKVPFFVESSPH